jgi:hypothetical protein
MAPKWHFSPNLIQIVPDHNRYKPCGNNRLQMLLDFSPDSSDFVMLTTKANNVLHPPFLRCVSPLGRVTANPGCRSAALSQAKK